MKTKYLSLLTLGFLLVANQTAIAADSATPQIWFNLTNYNMPGGVEGPQGWNKLFVESNAPWPEFMNHVQVVAAAAIQQVPDDVLAKMFAKLKEKHIAFAIESLAQSWVHEPECGRGVESYYDPPGARKVAEKIRAAGGQIDFIAMDEPLFYGRYYNGPNACHSSIRNVAERAAAIMLEYKRLFPNVVIGDIEPVPALTTQTDWPNEYSEWLREFSAAVGQPIKFLQIDINWGQANASWQQSLPQAIRFAHTARLPVGIIYNSNMAAGMISDQQWLDSALQNIRRIEGQMRIVPDQAIFHSWSKFPRRSITDANGPGEDYLVKRYLQLRNER